MSMSSAMNAGVTGLAANSTRLATISDNIANSSTYGYKRMETEFSAFVLNQNSVGNLHSAGGVRAATYRDIIDGGALMPTANPLDIAISGRGMLPVTSAVDLDNGFENPPFMMTRTGSFSTDESGVLRTETGLVLLGWPVQADGTTATVSRDSMGSLEPVRLASFQTVADPTTEIRMPINLPAASATTTNTGAALPTLSVEYFGNLGTSEFLDVSFAPVAGVANTWTMNIADRATTPATAIASYQIEFDSSAANGGSVAPGGVTGGPYDPVTGNLNISLANGEAIDIFIGVPNGPTGMRQLSTSFSPASISKNGSPVGQLSNVEIDEDGYIKATYDTGFVKTLYQIPLVDVPNPNGLISLDGQAFKISTQSGGFFLWDAGDGPTGSVQGYSREASTTDVAQELTHLIETQRAYSSNAKIIQTVDEMLQETTNIKR